MSTKNFDINSVSPDKFAFVQLNDKITDKKFDDKPIGYLKDAWLRFKKNKASVIATVIIIIIVLFAFLTPIFTTKYDATFMDPYYAKKAPRNLALSKLGICNGGKSKVLSEVDLIHKLAKGIGAMYIDGADVVSIGDSMENKYQPILSIGDTITSLNPKKETVYSFETTYDEYLDFGFLFKSIQQSEYNAIIAWQQETGIQVLFPLLDTNSGYQFDPGDYTIANWWYKTSGKGVPVTVNNGKAKTLSYSEDLVLEDNYLRDANGNCVYYQYTGGGDTDTAQYKVRILYYNYYLFKNGFEPEYILGTDSQGYDLSLRMADGIKLSLLVAVCVSAINLVLGALYGAIEGYYGGVADLIMERVSDILSSVPFIIVATLFQQHFAKKLGPVVCLLFAYVLTGWIGTAYRVRTQFYRFKNSEYVMAARTLGARDSRIIWKHIFPNSLGTIITSCALVIPGVINSESMLSYLGIVKLGTSTTTSLGTLLSDASAIWTNYPHLMIYPALVLSLLMICFNLFGNGLRDAFNPSLRGVEE